MRGRLSSPVTPRMLRSAAFAMLCVIWGSTWLAIRIGLQGAPPFLSATLRFLLASITLAVLAIVFRSKWPANRTEWALVVFVGLVLFTADYGLIYWGENNGVESGLSAILFATLPLQTALVANAILPGERLTVQKLAGIGLGFGGILLIFRGQIGTAGFDKAFPMLAIVLSATCAAFATVAIKRWGPQVSRWSRLRLAKPGGLLLGPKALGRSCSLPSPDPSSRSSRGNGSSR